MKKITFGLSTTSYLLSDIIRFVQGLSISHSYVEYHEERYDEQMIYEAKGLNTYIMNKNHFDKNMKIVYEFETFVSDELFQNIMKHIHENAGIKYGWKEMVGHLVKKIASLFFIKINNPFPQKATICSEACGDLLVLFFGVKADVRYSDMDLIWLLEKLKNHPLFTMTKGE
jgi:hypothetical protein